jgi:hypothetical protein
MSYPQLYKRLAQEILHTETAIGRDTSEFVDSLLVKLRAEGWQLTGDAKTALNDYFAAMDSALKASITQAVVIGSGLELSAANLQSKAVLKMAEQAFIKRWPDGLKLSERLWRWHEATREGVRAQLQAGARLGKSGSSVLYDMQRTIERTNGARRFEIVSSQSSKWVRELTDSARLLINNPAAKAQWQTTVDAVEIRIEKLARTGTRHAAERLLSQIKAAVDQGKEALVNDAVKWWTYDKQLYHLKRIVRTEMATAAHNAVIDSVADDDTIIGFQWRLSGGHAHAGPDICDDYANIEMGLGKGVWSKEAVPRHKAHPHCTCQLIARIAPIKQAGGLDYQEFLSRV